MPDFLFSESKGTGLVCQFDVEFVTFVLSFRIVPCGTVRKRGGCISRVNLCSYWGNYLHYFLNQRFTWFPGASTTNL